MDIQQSIERGEFLSAISEALSDAPVVALVGARQVGKTTLAEQVAAVWPGPSTVFDLEVAALREAMSATPERLLRQSTDTLGAIDHAYVLGAETSRGWVQG